VNAYMTCMRATDLLRLSPNAQLHLLALCAPNNTCTRTRYLDNVYPDMFIPTRENVAGRGFIKNIPSKTCIDTTSPKAEDMKVRLVPCESRPPSPATSEFYMWTKMAQLRIETDFTARCIDSSERGENKPVGIYPCHGQKGNQEFEYTPKLQIRHIGSGMCLTAHREKGAWHPVMATCKYGEVNKEVASPLQRWSFSMWHDY
jgi:hypothetical protein